MSDARIGLPSRKFHFIIIPLLLISGNLLAPLMARADPAEGGAPARTGTRQNIEINFTRYHSYEEVTEILESVAEAFPEISVLHSIGKTYEGRDVWALKISDNPAEYEPDEAEVLYIGMHHAREWITYEIILYFIDHIIKNYGTDPWTTFVVDNRQLWIIPMLNPDGFVFDGNGDYSNRGSWRKNREPNWDGSYGTDLNRNYGWHWGELGYQGYANPRREDYIGPYDTKDDDGDIRLNEDPMDGIDNDGDGSIDEDTRGGFSTAETRIIRDLATEHDFKISMAYHSYAETIYWGWMYTRQLPPDEQLYKHLAEGIHRYNGYEYRNYTEDDRNRRGPLVDGDLNDYLYGAHDILSFCIEVGSEATGGFYPPEDMIIPLCELNLLQNLYVAVAAPNPWDRYFIIEHQALENTTETGGPYMVTAGIRGPDGLELKGGGVKLMYSIDGASHREVDMKPTGNANEYQAEIPGQSTGTRISYYISVRSREDFLTLSPRYAPFQSYNFTVKDVGRHANPILTSIHGLFMMGTTVFFIIAAAFAVHHLRKKNPIGSTVKATMVGTVVLFIGGFPLGWAVAYQEYGTAWTGVPFGWDLVDNVTLILFILWVTPLVLIRKSIRKGGTTEVTIPGGTDDGTKQEGAEAQPWYILNGRTFSIIVILLAVVTAITMLALPHGS